MFSVQCYGDVDGNTVPIFDETVSVGLGVKTAGPLNPSGEIPMGCDLCGLVG